MSDLGQILISISNKLSKLSLKFKSENSSALNTEFLYYAINWLPGANSQAKLRSKFQVLKFISWLSE